MPLKYTNISSFWQLQHEQCKREMVVASKLTKRMATNLLNKKHNNGQCINAKYISFGTSHFTDMAVHIGNHYF